ncbi:LamG-like jellyroll fold domain-containing protein, partial [uncultured Algibacter sp.]|uniref:LamG-like jellyroll fold domain-containing protein n=1 Tax=uncultured Algibacter sp. TaxID=298659 RepID=UPI0026075E0D
MEKRLLTRSKILVFTVLIKCSLAFSITTVSSSYDKSNLKKEDKLTLRETEKAKSFFDVNVVLTQVTATCANNGSITAVASGATSSPSLYLFKITDGPTANGQTYPFIDQFHSSVFTFNDLYPGVYEVTVEDAGDLSNPPFVGNITVIDETEVLDFSSSSTAPNCPGESTGSISVSVSEGVGPYEYQIIDGPTGTTTGPISDSSTSYIFNNLPSGNYRIRVFDVCGDFQTRNQTINSTSSSSVFLNGRGVNRISCTEAIYSVDVFGSGLYTYEVVGGAPSGYSSSNTTGDFTLPINQAPYTFSVTGSCGQTDTYTHNNPTANVFFSTSNKTCSEWDLSLNPSWMVGPYTYTLTSTPAGYTGVLTNTTGDFDDMPYGSFSYTVSDSCGNIVSGNGDVQSEVIQINSSTDAQGDTCNPGLGSVIVSYNNSEAVGPVTFELTTVPSGFAGDAGPKNGNVFDELVVGNYVVTGTDACGNVDTHAFEFEAEDALNVDFDIDVIQGCINSHSVEVSVTSNVGGGFGAKWFRLRDAATGNLVNTAASFFGPATFSNVSGGEYYIEYDIFSGCSVYSDTFEVESYEQPRLTPLSSYTCSNNGFVSVSGITDGGVGPFTYSLINTANNQVIATNTECYFSNQDASISYAVRIEDNCGNSSSAQVTPINVGLGLEFLGQTCASVGDSFSIYLREYTGVDYNWTFPDGTTFSGTDPRSTIGIITSSDYGEYNVIASTSDGCRTQTLILDFDECPPAPINATIDFDGEDDYLDTTPFITNWTEGTIMSWVKISHTSNGNLPNLYSIAGQENMRLFVTNGRTPAFVVITQDQVTSSSNYPSNNIQVQPDPSLNIELVNDLWYHLTGVFNATDQTLKLYINGELVGETTNALLNSELLTENFNGTPHIYSQREFTVGRYPTNTSTAGFGHFKGSIDEVRIFEKALTNVQIQQMVYQEIENNSGFLRGKIIPKDIQDLGENGKVLWSALKGYYPMTNILGTETADFSLTGNNLTLHNITTILEQTAPMPYATSSDGAWTSTGTWLYGDVWDIADTANNKDWSIVKISNEVTACHGIKTLGLIIDSNTIMRVHSEKEVENSWYLELNGTLDLEDDCQLVQTEKSDLVTSSTGKILRRQEGQSNPYRYNYWSSPVGVIGATSLLDNNGATNNTNNTAFNLQMLKDESGAGCLFTSGYTGSGSISSYWLNTFINGVTYWSWAQIGTTTALSPGVGYTQKGTGVGGSEQQYIFEGKPNNGTILIDVTDTGGP